MVKFKVGDRVIARDSQYSGKGQIIEIGFCTSLCLVSLDNGEEHWFQPREMSLEQEEHAPLPSPVTHFEVGHWYKWIGPKVRPVGWSSRGEMDFILDGEPHQCTQRKDLNVANFDNRPVPETVNGGRGMWVWGPLENFQEVDMGTHGDKTGSYVQFKGIPTKCGDGSFVGMAREAVEALRSTQSAKIESRAEIRKRLLGI